MQWWRPAATCVTSWPRRPSTGKGVLFSSFRTGCRPICPCRLSPHVKHMPASVSKMPCSAPTQTWMMICRASVATPISACGDMYRLPIGKSLALGLSTPLALGALVPCSSSASASAGVASASEGSAPSEGIAGAVVSSSATARSTSTSRAVSAETVDASDIREMPRRCLKDAAVEASDIKDGPLRCLNGALNAPGPAEWPS
mmetsp:Transcript_23744/g.60416  ORF Transcript_23744/g.60416 Transcript_23744/m.60416 type:complete len:201 (-) Transcript_23744:954-1556(-)